MKFCCSNGAEASGDPPLAYIRHSFTGDVNVFHKRVAHTSEPPIPALITTFAIGLILNTY
jgi:hypothetical protein